VDHEVVLDPALVQRAVEVSSKGEEGKIFFRFFSVFFPTFLGGMVQRSVEVSSECEEGRNFVNQKYNIYCYSVE